MVEPADLLKQYASGRVTRGELLLRLCQAAAEQTPGDLAAALPADVLAEVREQSAAPPDSPDRCRVFFLGTFAGDPEARERRSREEARRVYEGLWQWHRYFAAAEPGAAADRAGGSR